MPITVQRSFSGGELAPSLYARTDAAKYSTGLRTCRNCFIMKHGGAQNRPGTEFVAEVKDSTKQTRAVPFIFNSEQTYVLEFGDQYIRFHQSGATIESSPGVPYEISSPYLEADLSTLQFVQSADVITITHRSYAPRQLSRTAHTSWTLGSLVMTPEVEMPLSVSLLSASSNSGAARYHRYKVTAIDADTGEESFAGGMGAHTITGITKANPAVVTVSGFGPGLLWTEEECFIDSVTGMTEINNRSFRIVMTGTVRTSLILKELTDSNVDSTGYSAYVSGGRLITILKSYSTEPTVANPITIIWRPVTNAKEYNVYKEKNGSYFYLGSASQAVLTDSSGMKYVQFQDGGIAVDESDGPPSVRSPFSEQGDYPSTSTYFQQRHLFANTSNETEKIWASQSGKFKNFTTRTPIQDDDAITFKMSGRQVNEVRHLIDLGQLVILTSGGEHVAQGDGSGVLTPTGINTKQYSYNGSSTLAPILVNGNAIYVQAEGSIVRDLGFDQAGGGVDGYRGDDLTIFSAHLVEGYTIVDWAFQKTPNSIIWAVRDDGALIALTYNREQQMLAWHKHDTDGEVESICSIPEGSEHAVYMVVNRTINGTTKRYIERMSSRFVTLDNIVEANFMDCSAVYDGRNVDTSHTMTLSGGVSWAAGESLTLTSNQAFFTADDVGNEIFLGDTRFEITGYTSTTVVTGTTSADVPLSLRGVATSEWSRAVDVLTGLDHLEGKAVSVFADASVVASPNNEAYALITVTGGEITLPECYAYVRVGLPYISDIQTLDIDSPEGLLFGKQKLVTKVGVMVEKTRGVWVGDKPPTDDSVDPLEDLSELTLRSGEDLGDPTTLTTDVADVTLSASYNSNGRVFIRQVDPLPMSILSIAPTGIVSKE